MRLGDDLQYKNTNLKPLSHKYRRVTYVTVLEGVTTLLDMQREDPFCT